MLIRKYFAALKIWTNSSCNFRWDQSASRGPRPTQNFCLNLPGKARSRGRRSPQFASQLWKFVTVRANVSPGQFCSSSLVVYAVAQNGRKTPPLIWESEIEKANLLKIKRRALRKFKARGVDEIISSLRSRHEKKFEQKLNQKIETKIKWGEDLTYVVKTPLSPKLRDENYRNDCQTSWNRHLKSWERTNSQCTKCATG